MKNVLFMIMFILSAGLGYSQGYEINDVIDDDGDSIPNKKFCTQCFGFDLEFTLTSPVSSGVLDEINLDVTSATGEVSGFDTNDWSLESIVDENCVYYTYSKKLSICFDPYAKVCDGVEEPRSEPVQFLLTVDGICFADYFNPYYLGEGCMEAETSCDPYEFIFPKICCFGESQPKLGADNTSFEYLDIKLSPNPCIDHLSISNLNKGDEVSIFSIFGKELKFITIVNTGREIRIDNLDDIPQGINILQVARDGKIVEQFKFFKN